MSDRTGFHIVWHTGRRSRGEINFPRHASVSKKWFTSLSSCVRVTSTTMNRIHLSGWKGSRGPPFTPEDNNYPRLIYTSRRAARKRNEKICMRAYIYTYASFYKTELQHPLWNDRPPPPPSRWSTRLIAYYIYGNLLNWVSRSIWSCEKVGRVFIWMVNQRSDQFERFEWH